MNDLINNINWIGGAIKDAAQKKIDFKTKPLGSLGLLEEIAVKICQIQNTLTPTIKNKQLFVFAGDHGVAEAGVSAFPQEVTAQMVLNFLNGGAAINVLCKHNGININVVDMGVKFDFNVPGLINKKIKKGTDNFFVTNAMSKEDALKAVQAGIEVFNQSYKEKPFEVLGLGDMGIGNTTASSAIISVITGLPAEKTTGRGTGVDDAKYRNKVALIENALKLHNPVKNDPIDILSKIGGFEIAGIAGAILAACEKKIIVVLDGIISTAGGLIAGLFNPLVNNYFFSGHRSVEEGQREALKFLNLNPIIDLNMRLGEGTGASLAINIIEAACKIVNEMSSFEDAGVSNKE